MILFIVLNSYKWDNHSAKWWKLIFINVWKIIIILTRRVKKRRINRIIRKK